MTIEQLNRGTSYLVKVAGEAGHALNPFKELGVGVNTDTDVKGKKSMPKDRESLKANPYLTGAMGAMVPAGLIGNIIYGGYKDVKNREYTGLDKLDKIDPGKFSWDRANYMADRSAQQHLNRDTAMGSLGGALLGAGGGALAGAATPVLDSLLTGQGFDGVSTHDMRDNALIGGLGGSIAGLVGGGAYGGYRGAKNYNEKVIDRL